jgi:hypothetical protein
MFKARKHWFGRIMAEAPSYMRPLESQLNLQKIGFGTMFTPAAPAPVAVAPAIQTVSLLPDKKLKFLLVSTHLHQFTGYSKVAHNFVAEFAKKPWIDLTHYGFQKHPQVPPEYRPYPSNVEVIDAAATEKPPQQGFGFTALPDVIRRKEPDVVFIYNDMSIVARFLEEIRKSGVPRTFKIWIYIDQVYNTQLTWIF